MTYNKDLAEELKKEICQFIHIALWILDKGEANENSRHDMIYLLGAHKLEIIYYYYYYYYSLFIKIGSHYCWWGERRVVKINNTFYL